VRLTLHRSGQADRTLSAPLGGSIFLDSLPTGTWTLEVALYKRDGSLGWYGTSDVLITGGQTANAVVHLRPATGNVNVVIVLDQPAECTVAVVVDTVHPVADEHAINSFRKVLWARAQAAGILIGVVYDPQFSVPVVVRIDGKDGTTLEVGNPFFECGGIVGPCNSKPLDTTVVQEIFVPFSDLQGSCSVGVLGTGPAIAVTGPCRVPVPRDATSFTSFQWTSQGGFAGGGTGESMTLLASGVLQRVLQDSAVPSRLDTTAALLDSSALAHVDSILARSDVRSLPAPEDTVATGRIADAIYDHFHIEGASGAILDLGVGGRYCLDDPQVASSPCPTSSGMDALRSLLPFLRSVPSGGPK
jgi:hypothetical protein